MIVSVFDGAKNIVGKGENAGYSTKDKYHAYSNIYFVVCKCMQLWNSGNFDFLYWV